MSAHLRFPTAGRAREPSPDDPVGFAEISTRGLCVQAPGGRLVPGQLDAIADVVARHSRGARPHARIAARDAMHVHSIPSREAPDALRRLARAGLTTREARGDALRDRRLAGWSEAEAAMRTPASAASPAQPRRWFHAVPVAVALGRMSAQQLTGLAVLMRRYGLDVVRTTADRNLVLCDVPAERLEVVVAGLAAIGFSSPRSVDR